MFIVRFWGGLGNQIFQYAFMRRLEIEYPEAEVYADLTDYRRIKFHHGFELEKAFGIKVREAKDDDIARIGGRYVYRGYIYDIFHRVLQKFGKRHVDIPTTMFSVVSQSYEFALTKLAEIRANQDVYFEGFWQRPEFFAPVAEIIKDECRFRYHSRPELETMKFNIESSNSVAVHIRRGDYIGSSFDVVGLDYYNKSIAYMSDMAADREPLKFFFFSDEPSYVREKFDHIPNKVIVDINHGVNSYVDMLLMSKCRHNIIAYSSFSYWGAYFNEHKGKIVIAPQAGIRRSNQRLVNDDWILL